MNTREPLALSYDPCCALNCTQGLQMNWDVIQETRMESTEADTKVTDLVTLCWCVLHLHLH